MNNNNNKDVEVNQEAEERRKEEAAKNIDFDLLNGGSGFEEIKDFGDRTTVLKIIKERRQRLASASQKLKEKFVGLDDIIDQIIRNIEVWYVMPEIVARPVIVNLWGMTGVGKTDLVRTLVRELKLGSTFHEIQLCHNGSSSGGSSALRDELGKSNLDPEHPGVLLLDEMQRFRTVDNNGDEMHDYKFQDLWALLSDGRFTGDTDRDSLIRLILEDIYWDYGVVKYKDEDEDDEEEEEKSKVVYKNGFRRGYQSARLLKRQLRLKEPINEIMTWDNQRKLQVATEKFADDSTYEGLDYSKLLIFISGNLDEAYQMAGDCEDADRDADVLHAFSKQINVIDIKRALTKRFKPEQISRFGNTHVIYPSLDRGSYEHLIQRSLDQISSKMSERHGFDISFDESVNVFVYRNGVYPSQGVRPLFSTIASKIENSIPQFVLKGLEENVLNFSIFHKDEKLVAVTDSGTTLDSLVCNGDLDKIKEGRDDDSRSMIAAHEAGHAVLYAVYYGYSPTEVTASLSGWNGGYVAPHNFNQETPEVLKNKIRVYLGGRASEQIFFGDGVVTTGGWHDISSATSIASSMVRRYGMDHTTATVRSETWNNASESVNLNSEKVNERIEEIVNSAQGEAIDHLKEHIPLLKEVAKKLYHDGRIEPKTFADICNNHGLSVVVSENESISVQKYLKKFEEFVG
jgi:cell division protease FtsH